MIVRTGLKWHSDSKGWTSVLVKSKQINKPLQILHLFVGLEWNQCRSNTFLQIRDSKHVASGGVYSSCSTEISLISFLTPQQWVKPHLTVLLKWLQEWGSCCGWNISDVSHRYWLLVGYLWVMIALIYIEEKYLKRKRPVVCIKMKIIFSKLKCSSY